MSVHLESPPTPRAQAPAHHRVPLVEVLRRHQDAGRGRGKRRSLDGSARSWPRARLEAYPHGPL
jgi:hypothetical protein